MLGVFHGGSYVDYSDVVLGDVAPNMSSCTLVILHADRG